MKLSKILPYLNYSFSSESELVKSIQEVSFKFTQNRDEIQDYLKDPRLSSAYTAFYLTTNIPKFEGVMQWMDKSWVEELKNCSLYDMGAGPGTFSFAFREWVERPVEIVQIETSHLMREQAKKIWDGIYPGEQLEQSLSSKRSTSSEKLMLFGHSANEMGLKGVLKYIEEIGPEHILFIEPGTKDFFFVMLEIRKTLITRGYQILFPCGDSVDCPMSHQNQDWCHQFIQVKQDSEVERLSQLVKKDRRLLPLTVQAFSIKSRAELGGVRIVRVFPETKFSFEWEVCDKNVIHRYQIMKRGLSKNNLDLFSAVKSGDHIKVELDKKMENQSRVKLKALNNIIIKS